MGLCMCIMKKGGEDMAVGFPLYIDLKDNNCTVFGGGMTAYKAVVTLLRFHAKVTVISPALCAQLAELDAAGRCITLLGGRLMKPYRYTIPGTDLTRQVIRIEKIAPTPEKYPRRFAKIQKAPL